MLKGKDRMYLGSENVVVDLVYDWFDVVLDC